MKRKIWRGKKSEEENTSHQIIENANYVLLLLFFLGKWKCSYNICFLKRPRKKERVNISKRRITLLMEMQHKPWKGIFYVCCIIQLVCIFNWRWFIAYEMKNYLTMMSWEKGRRKRRKRRNSKHTKKKRSKASFLKQLCSRSIMYHTRRNICCSIMKVYFFIKTNRYTLQKISCTEYTKWLTGRCVV